MAESNDTGSKTGDGTAAGNADFVTKADLAEMMAGIQKTLAGLPNMVNKAAQDQAGRQLKALGLDKDTIAKLLTPKADAEEIEDGADADAQAEAKKAAAAAKKAAKANEAGAQQQQQTVDFDALLKKQAADFEKRIKTVEEKTSKTIAEERAKREAAERAQVELRGTTAARAVLSKSVVPDAADLAFDVLVARKHLHIGEDGTPYYRSNPADEDSQVPFADGVTEFLKSPGAKMFLPAPQPKGGKQPPKPLPLPQNGAGASIHDKLAAVAAADGIDVETALV